MRVFSIARPFHRSTKRLAAGFPDRLAPGKRRLHEACLGRERLLRQWHRVRARKVPAAEAAAIVEVPLRTLYEWDKRAREGRLAPLPTRPRRMRGTSVTRELEIEILAIRREPMTRTWGPLKIVAELARRRGGVAPLSRATAGRVVRGLKNRGRLPERPSGAGRRHRRRAGPRPHAERRPKGYAAWKPGQMMQMDTKHLTLLPGGRTLYQHDLYDPVTKYAASRITSSLTAAAARDALAEMLEEIPYPVAGIQTDNGSEYRGVFEEFLRERGIRQQVIHPHTPKQNAHVERFHGTVDHEAHGVWVTSVTVEGLNREIARYIHHHNHHRPHQALGGRTPAANLRELLPDLPA